MTRASPGPLHRLDDDAEEDDDVGPFVSVDRLSSSAMRRILRRRARAANLDRVQVSLRAARRAMQSTQQQREQRTAAITRIGFVVLVVSAALLWYSKALGAVYNDYCCGVFVGRGLSGAASAPASSVSALTWVIQSVCRCSDNKLPTV